MGYKRFLLALICGGLLLAASACASAAQNPPPGPAQPPDAERVEITFDYEKQSGHASNQFALWIEDAEGNFVKTLYATRFTAKGGWKNRTESIPRWVEAYGLADRSQTEVDAVSGATPKTGALTYVWDCTDGQGAAVQPGTYRFFVEASLRWEMRALYCGEIEIGGEAVAARAEAEYFGEDGAERGMIGNVRAAYTPK